MSVLIATGLDDRTLSGAVPPDTMAQLTGTLMRDAFADQPSR